MFNRRNMSTVTQVRVRRRLHIFTHYSQLKYEKNNVIILHQKVACQFRAQHTFINVSLTVKIEYCFRLTYRKYLEFCCIPKLPYFCQCVASNMWNDPNYRATKMKIIIIRLNGFSLFKYITHN